ncbi:hypothetical protein SAMN05660199_02916 [Klenkia soli]|uniref:PPE family protein n=1 Tax=Klenkia soli TaxID=1052260 RepID=A0A1H0NZB3_9ACTN|nr:hypothetical protein [Klenkia soli]SDO97993.1 hypothetical protein SAMN05660199_02916 [Klenkia soli]
MPPVRTDQTGGYPVAPVEYDADPGGDFRLLDIRDIYQRLMLEDDAALDQAAAGWQALGQRFFGGASALRSGSTALADAWQSDAATALVDRVTAAATSFDAWGYVAVDRAHEVSDLATALRSGKSRLQQLWAEFHHATGELLTPPPDLTAEQRQEWRSQVAGAPAVEVNVRTYTQQVLDEVVNPLANRFSEAALSFTVTGPVYAGPTNAAVPSDAALVALTNGSWLPDGATAPPVPAVPAAPTTRSAPAVPAVPAPAQAAAAALLPFPTPAAAPVPLFPTPAVAPVPQFRSPAAVLATVSDARGVVGISQQPGRPGGRGASAPGALPVGLAALPGRQAGPVGGAPVLAAAGAAPAAAWLPSAPGVPGVVRAPGAQPPPGLPRVPGARGIPGAPGVLGGHGVSGGHGAEAAPGAPRSPALPGSPGAAREPSGPRGATPPPGAARGPGNPRGAASTPVPRLPGRTGGPGTPPPPAPRRPASTSPQLGGRTTRTVATDSPGGGPAGRAQLPGRGPVSPPTSGAHRAPRRWDRSGNGPRVQQLRPGGLDPGLLAPAPDLGARPPHPAPSPTPAERRDADRARRRAEWDAARRQHRPPLTP